MSFVTEEVRTARKDHTCCACNRRIDAKTQYVRWVGTDDGFQSAAYHTDCREAEVEWNRMSGGDRWDWYPLCDLDSEDFDWLCDAFPTVAHRLYGWSMFDWREPHTGHWWPGQSTYLMTRPQLRSAEQPQ